jgi:hypothetical protein
MVPCPCCGPRWYARLFIAWYRLLGEQLPPELEKWTHEHDLSR